MSDQGGELPIGGGALPDPMKSDGTGPLANTVKRLTPEQRAQLAEQRKAWEVQALRMADMLTKAGEDPNEARMMLGLEPIISGPEDDPRPWVSYHVPKEKPELDLEGVSEDVLEAINKLLAGNVPARKNSDQECAVCGALVADITKHMDFAHQESMFDTEGELDESAISDSATISDRFTTPEVPGGGDDEGGQV